MPKTKTKTKTNKEWSPERLSRLWSLESFKESGERNAAIVTYLTHEAATFAAERI